MTTGRAAAEAAPAGVNTTSKRSATITPGRRPPRPAAIAAKPSPAPLRPLQPRGSDGAGAHGPALTALPPGAANAAGPGADRGPVSGSAVLKRCRGGEKRNPSKGRGPSPQIQFVFPRIVEWFEWEETLKITSSNPPARRQGHLPVDEIVQTPTQPGLELPGMRHAQLPCAACSGPSQSSK